MELCAWCVDLANIGLPLTRINVIGLAQEMITGTVYEKNERIQNEKGN
jgi:hypothetical protein